MNRTLQGGARDPRDAVIQGSIGGRNGYDTRHVLRSYIRCTQDALWNALTNADDMAKWHFLAQSVREEYGAYLYDFAPNRPILTCRTLETKPKSRIVSTFEPKCEGGGEESRVVYLIEPEGVNCRLTLEHYDLSLPVVAGEGVSDGWERWAAGLKTWLETGEGVRFTDAEAWA